MSEVAYRAATLADAAALSVFAAQAWRDTFGPQFTAENGDAYVAKNYGVAQQGAEISDPSSHCHLAFDGGELIGFCWTGPYALPLDLGEEALELHRLYVTEGAKGKGVAQTLLADAFRWAATRDVSALYLSVYELNARAIAFYRRSGFEIAGEHQISVGETPCGMLIMRAEVSV